MAVIHLTHKSEALQKHTDVNILLPDRWQDGMKLLYLLHGLSDNYAAWLQKSALCQFLEGKNTAVVMPDGGRSFYTNQVTGERYFDYISYELQEYVEKLLGFSKRREDRFIAGLSMGGYGAFKIALSAPERYMGAASFSGVMDVRARMQESFDDLRQAFPDPLPDREDLFFLALQASKSAEKPVLYQWCGFSDFLYQDNLKFRDAMEKLPFDYHYFESEGDHQWKYWNQQLQNIISFFKL